MAKKVFATPFILSRFDRKHRLAVICQNRSGTSVPVIRNPSRTMIAPATRIFATWAIRGGIVIGENASLDSENADPRPVGLVMA